MDDEMDSTSNLNMAAGGSVHVEYYTNWLIKINADMMVCIKVETTHFNLLAII